MRENSVNEHKKRREKNTHFFVSEPNCSMGFIAQLNLIGICVDHNCTLGVLVRISNRQ